LIKKLPNYFPGNNLGRKNTVKIFPGKYFLGDDNNAK